MHIAVPKEVKNHQGRVTNAPVAEAHGVELLPLSEALTGVRA